jgi:hypothetical protein
MLVIEDLGAAEVTDLDDAVVSQENVLGLQVSVAHLLSMHVLHPLEYLLHVGPHIYYRDVLFPLLAILNDLFKVGLAELKD